MVYIHNTLWVKNATHQKTEFLITAFLSKLDNTVNSNSIFNTKYAEFFTKWQVLLQFYNPTCAYNHSYNLHQKSVPLVQPTFSILFHSYFNKVILTTPPNTPFLYTLAIFHLPVFAYNHPRNLHQRYFSYFGYLANSSCVKGPGSYGVL